MKELKHRRTRVTLASSDVELLREAVSDLLSAEEDAFYSGPRITALRELMAALDQRPRVTLETDAQG